MARLYKPVITRYLNPQTGRRCRKTDPGAVKKNVKSRTWRGAFRDADGILHDIKLCTNKSASRQMLNEAEAAALAGEAGRLQAERRRPLSEHLADFRRHLEAKGNTAGHVRQTLTRLEGLCNGCRFRRLPEIDCDRAAAWLAAKRDAGELATQTTNYYVAAARQFGNWLMQSGRAAHNPFRHLQKLNAAADVRVERRAISADELSRLIRTTAESNRTFRGLTGTDRAMLYATAAYTGLRASELASLTERSFDLTADPPTITVAAAYSKRRRRDVLPLHPVLAERLAGWVSDKQKDEPTVAFDKNAATPTLWPGTWRERAAEMLRADLQTADIPHTDDEGRTFDFHALRHTFVTMLASSGVHPKTAQTLARHSTITLTMDRYAHVGLRDPAGALEKLPLVAPDSVASATGTDDAAADGCRNGCATNAILCSPLRSDETIAAEETAPAESEKTLQMKGFATACDGVKQGSGNGAGRTRTCNQRIMSPLL